jgi:glutathionylspermidine amidase/synthetase
MITGRMDFCMDERGIKVYEYNADSASCHTEGGLILEEWVKNGYRGNGHNPAEGLLEELTGAWKQPRASVRAHHAGQRCRRGLSRALYSAFTDAGRV